MYDVIIQLTWQRLRIRKYFTGHLLISTKLITNRLNPFHFNHIGGSLSFFLHNIPQFLCEFRGGGGNWCSHWIYIYIKEAGATWLSYESSDQHTQVGFAHHLLNLGPPFTFRFPKVSFYVELMQKVLARIIINGYLKVVFFFYIHTVFIIYWVKNLNIYKLFIEFYILNEYLLSIIIY
jgi:hypothetical protein